MMNLAPRAGPTPAYKARRRMQERHAFMAALHTTTDTGRYLPGSVPYINHGASVPPECGAGPSPWCGGVVAPISAAPELGQANRPAA